VIGGGYNTLTMTAPENGGGWGKKYEVLVNGDTTQSAVKFWKNFQKKECGGRKHDLEVREDSGRCDPGRNLKTTENRGRGEWFGGNGECGVGG